MKMKDLENKKELNEVEEEEVSDGLFGGDVPTIPDLIPTPDFIPHTIMDGNDRPLPFPQDRRGNKAPVEAPNKGTHIL